MAKSGYTLASFATPEPGGYVWQNWAFQTLIALGARNIQGPGTLNLFGYPSASGIRHEIDAAGIKDVAIVIEAKDQQHSVSKEQIDSFHGRTLDYFEAAVQQGFTLDLHRMMWGTGAIDSRVRRYAARLGITLIGNDRIPIPVLLAGADDWNATEWLSDRDLGDLVLLGERACRPLRASRMNQSIFYNYPLDLWTERDLDDLEYIHELASNQLQEWTDYIDPLHFEKYAEKCLYQVSA